MWECQIVSGRSDPPSVARFDDEHLRRFLAARRAGDAVAMRRAWEELVIVFKDRMDGLVAANHKGRLDAFEHEEAVQRALIRFSDNLFTTFRGTSMGELVNATKKLCFYVCIEVQREAEQRSADVEAFVAWAMPQLAGRRRAVVERTFHGAPLPQICAELALSKDNAYQLRSRGLKDLAKLYERYGT